MKPNKKAVFVILSNVLFVSGLVAQKKPNVVLIYVDDLGYADLGCYGSKVIPTPNIDKLANRGVKFTSGYVACPVSGPSRLSLLTGSYPQHYGVYWNDDLWPQSGFTVPKNQKLITEAYRNEGYCTGMVGKWNITTNDPSPFVDEYHDVMNWKGAYYPEDDGSYLGVNGPEFRNEIIEWGPRRPSDEYLTDRLTRKATDFIEKHKGEPFFLYLAYNAPHSPFQADKKYETMFPQLQNKRDQIYAGMVVSLDENIGKVMKKLEDLKLDNNTLIVFISDNGPATRSDGQLNSAGLLRGQKANVYEGGIRIPYILKFPKMKNAGKTVDAMVSNIDIYPTLCAASGVKISDKTIIDGINLMPYIDNGFRNYPERTLYWNTNTSGAVRSGKWKLVISGGKKELFDLDADLGERNNQSENEKEVLDLLVQKWTDWNNKFPPKLRPNKTPK